MFCSEAPSFQEVGRLWLMLSNQYHEDRVYGRISTLAAWGNGWFVWRIQAAQPPCKYLIRRHKNYGWSQVASSSRMLQSRVLTVLAAISSVTANATSQSDNATAVMLE